MSGPPEGRRTVGLCVSARNYLTSHLQAAPGRQLGLYSQAKGCVPRRGLFPNTAAAAAQLEKHPIHSHAGHPELKKENVQRDRPNPVHHERNYLCKNVSGQKIGALSIAAVTFSTSLLGGRLGRGGFFCDLFFFGFFSNRQLF